MITGSVPLWLGGMGVNLLPCARLPKPFDSFALLDEEWGRS